MISRSATEADGAAVRGLSWYSAALAEALVGEGLRVTILGDGWGDDENTAFPGLRVVKAWQSGVSGIRSVRRCLNIMDTRLVHLQHELFMFGSPLTIFGPPVALNAVRGRKVPVATTLHGVLSGEAIEQLRVGYAGSLPTVAVRAVYTTLLRALAARTQEIMVHDAYMAEAFNSYIGRVHPTVIPFGIPAVVSRSNRMDALHRLGLPPKQRAIFFGYRLPYKGIETLRAAAKHLAQDDIEVLIAGDDPTAREPIWPAMPSSPVDNVREMGYVPDPILPLLFAVADVLVLPYSVGISASGPLSLAAAYEVPTIVSSVPTLADRLKCPETTFPVGDEAALAATIRRVVNKAEVQVEVLRRLAALREANSWQKVAAETRVVYERILHSA